MRRRMGRFLQSTIREVVFGVEDSIVSTLGAVSGIAVGSGDQRLVILSGLVIVTVEAISMSAGSYLSSKAAAEFTDARHRQDMTRLLAERVSDRESLRELFERKGFSRTEVQIALEAMGRERALWLREVRRGEFRLAASVAERPWIAAAAMGVWYVIGGAVILSPYLFLPMEIAFPVGLCLGAVALFGVGLVKSRWARGTWSWRAGAEMVAVSLVAAGAGVLIGRAFGGIS